MNQRGAIQFTTVLLILGIVVGGWAAFIFGPVYLDHATAKQSTQTYLNRFTSRSERADIDLLALYIAELNRIGDNILVAKDGTRTPVKGLGITKEMVTWKKDPVTGVATVGVEYSRTFQLKPLKKWKTINFRVFKEKNAGL